MIEVLFKSEELLIVADSESKIVYGNTRRNSAVKYLNELTPKSSKEAMSVMMLIVLILSSKYVVAKQIKVTTKTEVVVKLLMQLNLTLRKRYKESLTMVLHH